jgi:hypothetical protein
MKTVTAVFANRPALESALHTLHEAGFTEEQVGLVLREEQVNPPAEAHKGEAAVDTAVKGAAGGTALGGLIGLLAGAGALLVPGVGPVVAAGVFSSVLGATAAGAGIGALYGGIVGALTGWGVAEDEADSYARVLHEGGALLVVHAPNDHRAHTARDLLLAAGASVQIYD